MQCDSSCGYKVILDFFMILNHGINLQEIQEKFKNFKIFFSPLYTINNNIKRT